MARKPKSAPQAPVPQPATKRNAAAPAPSKPKSEPDREAATPLADPTVGGKPAIIPSIAGWARMTGYNTIFIDDRDPFAHGFVVK